MDSATKSAKGAFTVAVKKSILGAKVINAAREDQPGCLCHSFVWRKDNLLLVRQDRTDLVGILFVLHGFASISPHVE